MVTPLDELKPFEARITKLLCDSGFLVNLWEGTEGTLRDTCVFSKANDGQNGIRTYYHMFLSLWNASPASDTHDSFRFGIHELDTAKIIIPNTAFARTNEDAILAEIRKALKL